MRGEKRRIGVFALQSGDSHTGVDGAFRADCEKTEKQQHEEQFSRFKKKKKSFCLVLFMSLYI